MAIAPTDAVTAGTFTTPLGAITWPNGAPPDGSYLLAIAQGNTNNTITPPTTGAAWNVLLTETAVAGDSYTTIGAYWKYAASEPANQSWGYSASGVNFIVSMMSLSGAKNAAPQFRQTTNASSPVSSDGTLVPSALNAQAVIGVTSSNGTTALSTATGYTLRTSGSGSSTGWFNMMETANALTSSTSTAWPAVSCAATGTASSMNAFLFIISPAGGTVNPKSLTATLNLAVPGAKITGRSVTAALALVGSLRKSVSRKFTATNSPVGSFAKTLGQPFASIVGPIGKIARSIQRALTGLPLLTVSNFLSTKVSGTISQVLSGAFLFTGNASHGISRVLGASANATGALSSIVAFVRALAGSLAPVSNAISKTVVNLLSGALAGIGTASKAIRRALSSANAAIGNIARSTGLPIGSIESSSSFVNRIISRSITGSTALGGILSRIVAAAIFGAVGLTSDLLRVTVNIFLFSVTGFNSSGIGKAINVVISGSTAFAGGLRRYATKIFSAIVAPAAGQVSKSVVNILSGVISLVGSTLGSLHAHFATFTATVSPVGITLSKATARAFAATLNLVAALIASSGGLYSLALSASTTTLGNIAKQTTSLLSIASLGPIGTVAKSIRRAIIGALGAISSVGTQLSRAGSTLFFATFAPVSSVNKSTSRELPVAVVAVFGNIAKAWKRVFNASTIPVGSIARSIAVVITGISNAVGTNRKKLVRSISAFASVIGAQQKTFSRIIGGSTGLLSVVVKSSSTILASVINVSGSVSRVTNEILSGFVAPAATELLRIVRRLAVSTLGFTGRVSRVTWRNVVGSLAAIGSSALTSIGKHFAFLTATLGSSAAIKRYVVLPTNATASAVGSIARQITVPFTASTTNLKILGNVLTFAIYVYENNLKASMSLSGTTSKTISRGLNASVMAYGAMAWQNILAAITSLIGALRTILVVPQAPQRHFRIATEITDTISLSTPIYPGMWRTSSTA